MNSQKTSRTILTSLLSTLSIKADWMILGFTNPYEFRNAMEGRMSQAEWDHLFEKRERKKALDRLRKKKWIICEKKGEHVRYQLSEDAFTTAIKERIILSNEQLLEDQCLLVVFDFPEAAKKARTAFRTFLKQAEFEQKQLSVWISKKNVGSDMRALIRMLNIEKWVEVFTVVE